MINCSKLHPHWAAGNKWIHLCLNWTGSKHDHESLMLEHFRYRPEVDQFSVKYSFCCMYILRISDAILCSLFMNELYKPHSFSSRVFTNHMMSDIIKTFLPETIPKLPNPLVCRTWFRGTRFSISSRLCTFSLWPSASPRGAHHCRTKVCHLFTQFLPALRQDDVFVDLGSAEMVMYLT